MNSKDKKKELRKITAAGVSIMTVALLFSSIFLGNKVERTTLWAKPFEVHDSIAAIDETHIELEDEDTALAGEFEKAEAGFVFDREKMPENYVVIPKQDSEDGLAMISDEYNYRTVYLDIRDKSKNFYSTSSVVRYNKSEEFTGEPVGHVFPPYLMAFINGEAEASEKDRDAYDKYEKENKNQDESPDPVANIKVERKDKDVTRFVLTFNRLYVPELFEDDDNYYISLRRPKDVYKKILVIDLGHGGKDAGTFSGDSKVYEKDTVLNFGLKLKALFDKQDDIKVY